MIGIVVLLTLPRPVENAVFRQFHKVGSGSNAKRARFGLVPLSFSGLLAFGKDLFAARRELIHLGNLSFGANNCLETAESLGGQFGSTGRSIHGQHQGLCGRGQLAAFVEFSH